MQMNAEEHIRRLGRAADWRAALIIFVNAFGSDQRVWQHVDLVAETICFRKMLADGTFSSGERTLLGVAASLFNQEHALNLWQTFNRLDDRNAALVVEAIESFCQSPE